MNNEENTDLFGKNQNTTQVLDLATFHPIFIEIGKDASSTKIKTANGEELTGVTKMSINIDAEGLIHTATLTFINPKIITK
ncbi:hypothetical protein [Acinetobacter sp.]|uniref:hypothetical protein n=1 Tax=Acinetobacter sp. TaxID=472 RepID=UPI00374FF866